MTPRSVISLGLLLGLSAVPGAHARDGAAIPKTASAETIDWAARGCNALSPFGFRFGERPSGRPNVQLGETRHPFRNVTQVLTYTSKRTFRIDTMGMFQDAPGSTQSDREAGRILFEAIDARIQVLGNWARRERVVDEHGDITITYNGPSDAPDSDVKLEMTLMLGGVWMNCRNEDLYLEHLREAFA